MPLHEVVVRQQFANQEIINRYNYVSSGTPAAVSYSFGLASAMGFVQGAGVTDFPVDTLASSQQLMQHPDVSFTDILVKDVYSVTDFYTTSFNAGTNGTLATTGDSMGPFIAYGFRSDRTRLDIRSGFKRYVGVDEEQVNGQGIIDNGFRTGQMVALSDDLGEVISYDDEGNTLTYQPVIVKKFKYTTPSGRTAYRYATDEDGGEAAQLAQVADADNWSGYSAVRSQGSRQYGRGT